MSRRRPRPPAAPAAGGAPPASLRREGSAFLLVLALLWAVVLAVDPLAREAFRQPKAVAGAALAAASIVALAGSGRLRLGRGLAASPALRALAPLAVLAVASALLSPHPAHVARTLPLLLTALAATAAWSAGFGERELRRLLDLAIWPATALAALGLAQALGLFQPFAFEERSAARLEVTSLAGNVGDLGAALVLPLLLSQVALFAAPTPRRRALALGQLALLAGALAASQTLAALGAAAAGSLALWAGLLPRRRLLPAALALLAAGGMVVALAAPVRERVVAKARDALSGDANRLLTGRLDGWRAAVWMASERPHAGVGPGAFAAAFVPAKLALLDRGAAFFREQTNPVFANAHNELLEVGAELGLPGLAALAWGGSVLLGRLRRRRWEGGDRALAGAALVALAVLALFHFPFRLALTGYPAALLLAWVLGDPDREEPGTVSRGRARAAALGLALLFALALWPAAGRLAASRLVRAAETRTLTAVRAGLDPAARRLLEGNVAMLDDAIRKDPAAISARVALGAQHLLLGHAESAIAAYRQALALEPRPEIYLNLARAQRLAGRDEEARAELATALRLAPHLATQIPSE